MTNNCTNPPHFPPHCGCPAGFTEGSTATMTEDLDTRMRRAGEEIRELKDKADAVAARLEALDRAANQPAAVRRRVLTQVWDKLMDEGHIQAATIVMRMRDSV